MGSKQSQVKLVFGSTIDKYSLINLAKDIFNKTEYDFSIEYDIGLKQSKKVKLIIVEILYLLSNCEQLVDKPYRKFLIYPDMNLSGKCLLKIKTDNLTQKEGKKERKFYKIAVDRQSFYYEDCAMSGKRLSIEKHNLNYENLSSIINPK